MTAAKTRISYPHVDEDSWRVRRQGLYRRDQNPRQDVVFLHKGGANDKTIREAYPGLPRAW